MRMNKWDCDLLYRTRSLGECLDKFSPEQSFTLFLIASVVRVVQAVEVSHEWRHFTGAVENWHQSIQGRIYSITQQHDH